MQENIASEKRSIRDIPLPKRDVRSPAPDVPVQTYEIKRPVARIEKDMMLENNSIPPRRSSAGGTTHHVGKGVWFIAVLAVVALAFALTWVLSKTTINLDIKKVSIPVQGVFVAGQSDTEDANFTYDTIELTTDLTRTVDATGSKEVSNKATGTVIIYNNYSTAAQQLVAGTRVEDANGLIFKINNAVTVPGKKTVSGKETPGSIEVKVTAENPGDKYNIALSDLTIPGFKGTPKFNGFYARSKTPMSGGMVGTVAEVSPEVLAEAQAALQKDLEAAAVDKVKKELPKEFVFLDGAYKIAFSTSEPTQTEGNKAVIKETASIKGFIFRQEEFVRTLATDAKIQLIDGVPLALDQSGLKVASIEENTPKGFFKLEGTLLGTYIVDDQALKDALKDKNKKDVPKILTDFPAIDKAQVIVSPFWVSTLPGSDKKIHIVKDGVEVK